MKPASIYRLIALAAFIVGTIGTGTIPASAITIPFTLHDISPDSSKLYGGRVADMAVDPATSKSLDKRILAVSDNGGLWQSTDTGNTWIRLSGLDRYGQFQLTNVVFDPTDATGSRVFLLSRGDSQAPPKSGVYRSTNGGASWLPAQNSLTSNHPSGCTRNNATRLAVDPTNSQNVYVAAQCAVGISHNGGATFQWVVPSASDSNYNGIMVDRQGRAFACGWNGVYRRSSDLNWVSAGAPFGLHSSDCFLAPDPFAASHFYLAGHWDGKVSPDGCEGCSEIFEGYWNGSAWVYAALLADKKTNGRPVFIQPQVFGGGDPVLSIYYGNSVGVEIINCNPAGSPTHCPVGARSFQPGSFWNHLAWTGSALAVHADPTSLVFDGGGNNCLLLYAADGGFERPAGNNCDGTGATGWSLSNHGFHAQQAYNMYGTQRLDGTTDLYISLQDNGFMYRTGAPPAWDTIGGSDGAVTAVDRRETGFPIRLAFVDNVWGVQKADALYANATAMDMPAGWNFPLGTFPGRRGIDSFGNQSYAVVADNGSQTILFTTTNEGFNWSAPALAVSGMAGNDVRVSGTTASPVFYVRASRRLWRIDGLGATTAVRADVGLTGVGFYGVSPSSSNLLYAFDCAGTPPCTNGRIVRSTTSGQSWVADPVATRLSQVDRFGNRLPNSLNLSDPLRYQPQVFEFDPSDSNIVVIGLRHAGVLVSIDRGVSWGRLPVTVPLVSSVVFAPERGHFYFSTYSRGVWEVWLGASKLAIAAPQTLSTGQLKLTSSLKDMDSGALAGQPVVLQLLNSKGVLVQKISATTSTKGVATAIFNKPPSPGIYYFRAIYAGGKAILGTQTQRRYLKP